MKNIKNTKLIIGVACGCIIFLTVITSIIAVLLISNQSPKKPVKVVTESTGSTDLTESTDTTKTTDSNLDPEVQKAIDEEKSKDILEIAQSYKKAEKNKTTDKAVNSYKKAIKSAKSAEDLDKQYQKALKKNDTKKLVKLDEQMRLSSELNDVEGYKVLFTGTDNVPVVLLRKSFDNYSIMKDNGGTINIEPISFTVDGTNQLMYSSKYGIQIFIRIEKSFKMIQKRIFICSYYQDMLQTVQILGR